MRFLSPYFRPCSALPLMLLALLGVTGCSRGSRPAPTAAKDGPAPTVARRQSEFDFYCSMRPPSTVAGSAYGSRPFAPAAFEAMKGQGYKVYLVSYRYARPVDGFGGFGGLLSGYGLRDFFGLEKGMGVVPSKVVQGQRLALVWETGRGECFLVDHYYATPVWLDGTDWLERVRFYDPAAVSVALERS